ncbi:proline--tRNA ligase [Alphaproteobacteria bacterium]|nr:proline--tRNA ligase [Alphaproteobacteria bacterium]GHS95715.1 proline--tRNA ligase [Alphaproteobacteria bacterium]
MRFSQYFLPTLREVPAEAQVVSHQLMLRAGMIHQTCSGIYSWLPLGFRVLSKIEKIIAEEQDRIGCHRVLMPTLQPAKLWQESGRYEDYGKEMLRLKDRHDRDMLYGPTHEEVCTDIARHFIKSYKQLPTILYQISWKFRDEIRPRFGVMRGREFLMKDGYSFNCDRDGAVQAYKKIVLSYLRTFERLGVRAVPVRADSGAIGGDLSHEFHIMAETGESEVFYDQSYDALDLNNASFDDISTLYTAADEKHDPNHCPIPLERVRCARGIEVGHVFYFGQKYSKSMGLSVMGKDGQPFFPEMGSYGIGVSRLVAALIEAHHDKDGILWPEAVAPFQVGIVLIKDNPKIREKAEQLYQKLQDGGIETLYDDRTESAGIKFSDMDLIGLPHQILLGENVNKGVFEWKDRRTGARQELSWDALLEKLG